ncbi:MAG TPA: hypothetical protein VHB02_08055 [Acidimicrobiales bacterium]|nr:hypothetical protein [Acidimicrobiales bacterium]
MSRLRLSVTDLGPAQPIGLPPNSIGQLAEAWGGSGNWRAVWGDIEYLASRLFEVEGSQNQESGEIHRRWHHLVLAVGNFKRQAGMIEPTQLAPRGSRGVSARPTELTIPETTAVVRRDVPSTWQALTAIPGIGVPTATTLLSALWPGHHVIIDRRDVTAAVGLGPGSGWLGAPFDGAWLPDSLAWDWYEWLRSSIRATPGFTMVEIERSLYQLDRRIRSRLSSPWSWSDYRPTALEGLSP